MTSIPQEPRKNRRGWHFADDKGAKHPHLIRVEGIRIPLNIKTYYRLKCFAVGCHTQRDGSYRESLHAFVVAALTDGWAFSRAGNFFCPEHALDAYSDTTQEHERTPQ